jgi:hypothetical protein
MNLVCCNGSRALWLLGGAVVLAGAGSVAYYSGDWFKSPVTTAPVAAPGTTEREVVPVPALPFTDVTAKAGIGFRHFSGMTDKKLLPETMGAGVIVLDFDNDGRPDLLFLNGCPWPGLAKSGDKLPTPALYRNRGDGTFEDVTQIVGPFGKDGKVLSFFSMGGTAGDYDNDGYIDLFLTGIGGNHLLHNEGGRRFVEIADTVVRGPGGWPGPNGDFFEHKDPLCFSSSASWLDYDGDGKLDLFVCNYVTWSPVVDKELGTRLDGTQRRYGQPTLFPGAQCFLYRNKGDGTFEDVSKAAGIEVTQPESQSPNAPLRAVGKSLGLIVCDADGDGWPDIIVANDTVRNFFFHNVARKDGSRVFEEQGLPYGVAYAAGRARGAMGIDWAPLYRQGQNAVLIGNFADEPDTFLCQDDLRQLQFSDVARAEGIAGPSQNPLKFGVFFFDCDLDGRLDFLTCNGHLDPGIGTIQAGQKYEQAPQLFWSTGTQRGFEPVPESSAGPDLFRPLVGRGGAYLDFNGDGALDLVLTNNGGPARLLRNDTKLGHHWVRLKLEGDGKRSNRSAIGAVVTLQAGGLEQRREVAAARGYLSQSELVLTFGLGKTTKIDKVTIRWPGRDGGTQVIDGSKLAIDREQTIHQGEK